MTRRRASTGFIILGSIVAAATAIAINYATSPPVWLIAYQWLIWSVVGLLVFAGICIGIWFYIDEQLDQIHSLAAAAPDVGTSSTAPAVALPQAWHIPYPYAMAPNFTGRRSERKELSDWLNKDAACPMMMVRLGRLWQKRFGVAMVDTRC